MNNVKSNINTILSMDYIINADENKYFDRKSSKIKPTDIADLISAFANAEGGTIVIGVSDKTRRIEGINSCGADRINDFVAAPKDCCRPMPSFKEEFLNVTNCMGEPDQILLLHIFASVDQVIRTNNGSTFLRSKW